MLLESLKLFLLETLGKVFRVSDLVLQKKRLFFQFVDKIHQIFWFLYDKCIPVDDDSTKWRCEVMQFTSSLRDEINVYHCSPFAKTRPEPDVT